MNQEYIRMFWVYIQFLVRSRVLELTQDSQEILNRMQEHTPHG